MPHLTSSPALKNALLISEKNLAYDIFPKYIYIYSEVENFKSDKLSISDYE